MKSWTRFETYLTLLFSIFPYSQFKQNSKDINLLIKSNPYTTTQKTPNLDLEKDRSHECKNSTEHLEKEIPCKTSTLTKVKRTYIWEQRNMIISFLGGQYTTKLVEFSLFMLQLVVVIPTIGHSNSFMVRLKRISDTVVLSLVL